VTPVPSSLASYPKERSIDADSGASGSWFLAGILAYSAVDKILHWSLFLKALTLYRVVRQFCCR